MLKNQNSPPPQQTEINKSNTLFLIIFCTACRTTSSNSWFITEHLPVFCFTSVFIIHTESTPSLPVCALKRASCFLFHLSLYNIMVSLWFCCFRGVICLSFKCFSLPHQSTPWNNYCSQKGRGGGECLFLIYILPFHQTRALGTLQKCFKKIQAEEEVKTLLGDLLTKIRLQNVLFVTVIFLNT